jgi:hypothetical protein
MLIGITYSAPTSDEETLKNLEMESSKYSNSTQKDADFLKGIMGPEFVILYPQGTSSVLTPSNVDKEFSKYNAAEPDGKYIWVYSDVKARVFGDVGIVSYKQKVPGLDSKIPPTIFPSKCRSWTHGKSNQENGNCSAVPMFPAINCPRPFIRYSRFHKKLGKSVVQGSALEGRGVSHKPHARAIGISTHRCNLCD